MRLTISESQRLTPSGRVRRINLGVADFTGGIAGFDSLPHPSKIKLFAWFLQREEGADRFTAADIRSCYVAVDCQVPDLSIYLPRLARKKPPELLKDSRGYHLEGRIIRGMDAKYGQHPATIAVTRLLTELPSKIPDLAERAFVREALDCYRVKAYRAAIVMAWNLAIDHLLRSVLDDSKRLTQFNEAIGRRFPKKKDVSVSSFDDFLEGFSEWELLAVCQTAGLVTKEVGKVLDEKLKRRNSAAHPSGLKITQHQADDVITDLVNNVILRVH